MSITQSARIAVLVLGVAAAGLTAGTVPAVADPGPAPCAFQGCQGPGPRGPAGPPGDRPGDQWGPGPAEWRGDPGRGPGGPQWRGDGDDRGWRPPPPPADLGWRGIDQGRFDHQPFNYLGHWVSPVFDPGYNNWGFWLFGAWIPL